MAEKEKDFVNWVIDRATIDNGFKARMRRADNEDTEDQCWEYLARFNIDIANDFQRLPYQLVGAAICKAKLENDGATGFGAALASCEGIRAESSEESPDSARLRRLLSCSSLEEACQVLRPLLALVNDKASRKLSYAALLKDLMNFRFNSKAVKLRWARDFFSYDKPDESGAHKMPEEEAQ